MGQISAILDLARQRGEAKQLSYAGEVTPREAWALLEGAPGAVLVDVRSQAECYWVGRVPNAIEIEWMNWPGMHKNDNFLPQLKRQVDAEALVLFLCRSAQRSHHAAVLAAADGWNNCYNVLEGFEGDKDAQQQRGNAGGWRSAKLPWIQN